jgi:DNA-binding transcriptional LysR family regulator
MVQSSFVIDLRARQLEAFLAVAEELHFGRAARRLGLAQSAVSQHIHRLEETLGVELLLRTSRQVTLTAAGEALRHEAADLLGRFEGVAQAVHAFAAGDAGTVNLGAQGAALLAVVPAAIARLATEAPSLHVNVRQLTSHEQVTGLLRGTLDLGLLRGGEPHPDLVVTELIREPVLAVLAAGHPLAGRPVVDLAALADEQFILWGRWGAPDFHDAVITACVRAGFTPRIGHRVRGIVSRLGYIAAGLGVGLEAASYATLRHEGVVFRPLRDDPIEATVQLAGNRRPPTPAAVRLAAVLAAEARARRSS